MFKMNVIIGVVKYMKLQFQLEKKEKNTKARLGSFIYNGKTYETPMFMPVGTQATFFYNIFSRT